MSCFLMAEPCVEDIWQARVDSILPTFQKAAGEMGKAKIDQEAKTFLKVDDF